MAIISDKQSNGPSEKLEEIAFMPEWDVDM
jgi:hypothetical protein